MRKRQKQSGISLTEILVVIAVMAILMGVSIPAAKQLMGSFESSTGTRQLINAALSNARAIAVRNQTYAGVRFQEDTNGNTYIIFIEHDKGATGLANGFRAVTGRKPMKLSEDVGVLTNFPFVDTDLDTPEELNDAITFSIIFTPQGKLTVHPVRVRNYEGATEGDLPSFCPDNIFNIQPRVDGDLAMFYQDDYFLGNSGGYPDMGLGEEDSTQGFRLFSKSDFKSVESNFRWKDYFATLNPEYISPYTGELVMEYRD